MTIQKYKYIDSINPLVPSLYTDREDLSFGVEEELSYKTLAHFLKLVGNVSSFFDSSSVSSVAELQSKFVPANKLTRVNSDTVNDYLLAPLGKDWKSFAASSEFVTFMDASGFNATKLGATQTNPQFALWFSGDEGTVPGVSSLYPEVSTVPLAQDKMIEKFGLLHFLNSSGPALPSSKPVAYVSLPSLTKSLWTENLYGGSSVDEETCLHVLAEYIWKNRELGFEAMIAESYIPTEFLSSTAQVSSSLHLSGTQLLDAYKKSLSLWVNSDMDTSPMVQSSLDVYLSSTLIPTKFANSGSLSKFLRALGYASYDVHHVVDSLSDLIDIDDCPPEFLDYLATLIGWKLIGNDATQWRQQLRNAVVSYRMKGTASGLDAVVEYIFDRDVFFPTSGLIETWESYLPNLIYYVIKSESFMASALPSEMEEWGSFWRRTRGIKVNYDPDSQENNIRFAVDIILQHLDTIHNLIHIKGKPWKQSAMWKGIVNNPNSANGFEHRGKIVEIPPWENDRFYADSYVTLDSLTTLSSILARGPSLGGLGLTQEASKYVTEFCKANLGLDQTPPMPGDRQRFKFQTSSLAVAPNTSSLPLQSAKFEDVTNLSDYWNRKSSVMVLDINALDANFSQKGNSKLNLENLRMLHQVFREFMPLRVMVHSVITNNLADGGGSQQQNDGIFDGYGWGTGGLLPSGVICIRGDYSKQDAAINIVNESFASGFVGLQNGGISAGTYQEGRYVPDVNATYWDSVAAVPYRTSSRSRNLRYSLPGRFFSRNGRNTPHSLDFMSTYSWGSTSATMASAGDFLNVLTEGGTGYAFSALEVSTYQPKGWNFSSQSYLDVSSREYDTSNAIKAQRERHSRPRWQSTDSGLPASACFPFRAAERYAVECSAGGAEERHRVFEITRTIIDIIFKNYKASGDRALLNFNHEDLLNKEFGTGVNQLFRKYKNEFLSRLDDSGFSLLNHTFGPFLAGGDLPIRGSITNGDLDESQTHTPGRPPGVDDVITTRQEYKNVIGGNNINANVLYNSSGSRELIESYGLASEEGLHSWKPDIDSLYGSKQHSNVSLLSSVEVVASPVSESFAVLNDAYSRFKVTDENVHMISLYGRGFHKTYEDCLKFRYPLNQNKNFISNPTFLPNPPSRTNLPLYSLDVKGWDLSDVAKDPTWNNTGSVAGTLAHVKGSTGPFSQYNVTNAIASGNNYILLRSRRSAAATPFRNQASPTLKTSIQTHFDTSSTDLKPLRTGIVPGKTYKLSIDTVAEVATGSWTYVLTNVTKNEVYSEWGWGTSSYNQVNVSLPVTSTTIREVIESDIAIPTRFEPDDEYQLNLSYVTGAGSTAVKWAAIYNVSFKEVISYESNTLMPDSYYRFTIVAGAEGTNFDNLVIPRKFAALGVRVSTDIVIDEYGRPRRYVYNFAQKSWVELTQRHYTRDLTRGVSFFGTRYNMYTPGGEFQIEGTSTPYIGSYHRMDENGVITFMEGRFHTPTARVLTPVSTNHYTREATEDGVIFGLPSPTKFNQFLEFDFDTLGGSHIHNSETGYYIEFFRVQGPNPERIKMETRIDVHKIHGYNRVLNEYTSKQFNTADYDRDDTEVIMRFFDSIISTYKINSRNSNDSASYTGALGGGRSEMLSPYGGSKRTNGDDGEATFGTGNGSTTLYEV